jgi:hypothetical protein
MNYFEDDPLRRENFQNPHDGRLFKNQEEFQNRRLDNAIENLERVSNANNYLKTIPEESQYDEDGNVIMPKPKSQNEDKFKVPKNLPEDDCVLFDFKNI